MSPIRFNFTIDTVCGVYYTVPMQIGERVKIQGWSPSEFSYGTFLGAAGEPWSSDHVRVEMDNDDGTVCCLRRIVSAA